MLRYIGIRVVFKTGNISNQFHIPNSNNHNRGITRRRYRDRIVYYVIMQRAIKIWKKKNMVFITDIVL